MKSNLKESVIVGLFGSVSLGPNPIPDTVTAGIAPKAVVRIV